MLAGDTSCKSLRNILSVVQDFYPEMIHQAAVNYYLVVPRFRGLPN